MLPGRTEVSQVRADLIRWLRVVGQQAPADLPVQEADLGSPVRPDGRPGRSS
jgi:hypothetical protein